jgi:cytochrome c oxidase assembly protein subunit 15
MKSALLALVALLGVPAQALLGGLVVLTDLNPWLVAAHFLLSATVIALSTVLLRRMAEPDGPPVPVVRAELRWLAWGLSAVTAVVLVLGTVVTGSGPHSGDAQAPARFGLDPRAMSWLHADAVLVWFGLLAALLVARARPWFPCATALGALLLVAAARAEQRAAAAAFDSLDGKQPGRD